MPGLRLNVHLEVARAREQRSQRRLQHPGAVSAAEDEVELAGGDQGGAAEGVGVEADEHGRIEGEQLGDGKGLFGCFGEEGHVALVRRRFEEVVDVAEDVGGGEIAGV